MTNNRLTNDWATFVGDQFALPYFQTLQKFLKTEYATKTIYPPMDDIFNAFFYTPFHHVKVVILGQDPYHGPNQAHGLSFSVQQGTPLPPSLKNIFQELANDLSCDLPTHGDLTQWAKQGVLLLNTTLTVEQGKAYSHKGKGWEIFTDKVIRTLNRKEHPVVYILWGKAAQQKTQLIDTDKHYILTAPHPSPLSAYRGFFGSKHFSKANHLLQTNAIQPIQWEVLSNT